jgi:hypothetical protein
MDEVRSERTRGSAKDTAKPPALAGEGQFVIRGVLLLQDAERSLPRRDHHGRVGPAPTLPKMM